MLWQVNVASTDRRSDLNRRSTAKGRLLEKRVFSLCLVQAQQRKVKHNTNGFIVYIRPNFISIHMEPKQSNQSSPKKVHKQERNTYQRGEVIDSLIEPEFVGGQEITAMRIALKQSRSYSAIGGQAQQRKRCQDEDQPHVSQFSDCSIQHKSKLPRSLVFAVTQPPNILSACIYWFQ